jgi:NAD(P)-dependent dehydrogenase (short-subunit alcohol dehydrogenase family)
MRVDLAGHVALVAGAHHPIGATIASLLAANGAEVQAVGEGRSLGEVISQHARLDILVNVAVDAESTTAHHNEEICRLAALTMGEAGGRMVTIVSALGVVPARAEGTRSGAAAQIIAGSRSLALEFGERGILINVVAVGAIEGGDTLSTRLVSHVPLARAATLEEIAYAALFLVDPENSYMTGHVLTVDGGWTAGYARNF